MVVTGIRQSLQSAVQMKKNTMEVVDSIRAEDIGKLPDPNVAETLTRIPGVQGYRYGGEGASPVGVGSGLDDPRPVRPDGLAGRWSLVLHRRRQRVQHRGRQSTAHDRRPGRLQEPLGRAHRGRHRRADRHPHPQAADLPRLLGQRRDFGPLQ
ncbi:TonB-dependent receptor plug domain-containing protein [Caulobacter segnis]